MKKMLTAAALSLTILATSSAGLPLFGPAAAEAATITTGDRLVGNAQYYIGKVTYKFGSRDVQRLVLDCSSFTQLVYNNIGISLPWSSKQQSQLGSYVPRSGLQKGDLVFFSVHNPGVVDHVGIYIGGGKFIQNLPNAGVVITNLDSNYWKGRYITARRVR